MLVGESLGTTLENHGIGIDFVKNHRAMSLNTTLSKPIKWSDAAGELRQMLEALQGNILKGHGRDHARFLFFKFTGKATACKQAVGGAAGLVTPAWHQLEQAREFKQTQKPGDTFVSIFLSHSGYKHLEIGDASVPDNPKFKEGMKSSAAALNDPPPDAWDAVFQQRIDLLVLVADDNFAKVIDTAASLAADLTGGGEATLLGHEDGHGLRNANGDGIEHFGYVDGRSQPLMLVEDIEAEKTKVGIDQWDPSFGPAEIALVPDKAVTADETAFGSYFVFRKLEQDVRGFKAAEKVLARKLGLTGEDAERAGALVVGRFENGTPITLHATEEEGDVPNNFNYNADLDGSKCPFHSHIRKTNPRGSTDNGSLRQTPEPDPVKAIASERAHLMPRRGIPYGERATHPNDGAQETDPSLYPTGGVGLLFMAYQKDISQQFEFTQIQWSNSIRFPFGSRGGMDPVTGQGDAEPQQWPTEFGNAGSLKKCTFANFVSMHGGEYFFAPSITFLKSLAIT
jgi:Dyp-type peroxidase family